jgi:hypothetical protein
MENRKSTGRTDEQLREMLDETGTWVVHGPGNQVFGVAGSLRRALDRADTYARSGAVVAAVARVPPARIFIFHDQILRLGKILQERETA